MNNDFIRDLGDAVRKNPLSAALIGMGVLWLFTGSRPVQRAGDFARSTGLDRIPDAASNAYGAARSSFRSGTNAVGERMASVKGTVRDGVVDALDNVSRYGRDSADKASEYATSTSEAGTEILDTVRSNLSDIFRAQPLALGAIGIAIGAGIAATLPGTDVEADYLGETSDSVKAKAVKFATDQADRVTLIAADVVQAVTDEAVNQGLTFEGAKSAAENISAKVGRVVEVARKGISDRTSLN